jgi:selenocysteine lyase/cysteine desulfurase
MGSSSFSLGERVYADHAATSFPKAPGVAEAISDAAHRMFSGGRGGYREALDASAVVARCRRLLAELVGASQDEIILTPGATDGLNLVIKGVARAALRRGRGAHVITTSIDHNSVLRPVRSLAAEGVVSSVIAAKEFVIDPADIERAIRADTCLVVVNHASNVTGAIQPAREIAAICKHHGVFCLVDGAQTVGHIPVNVKEIGAEAVVFPGHKGLLGPPGIGAVYLEGAAADRVANWRDGGTGSQSENLEQPASMPTRFESGTGNVVAAAGLVASLEYLRALPWGIASVGEVERAMTSQMLAGLSQLKQIEVIGPQADAGRGAVFSVRHAGYRVEELASVLEASFGVLCRSGLACAPLAWGTWPEGGVRISFGYTSGERDVERVLNALDVLT